MVELKVNIGLFELYPDSMNPKSFKLLEELGGSYAHVMVSPLHDSDIKKMALLKRLIIMY